MSNDQFIKIDPNNITVKDIYKILLHCVSPRPIALTSTVSKDGAKNLAPFSFFMAGGANPPSVIISSIENKLGIDNHTFRNIKETGEFAISISTFSIKDQMNKSSFEFPDGVSEWDKTGLTPTNSDIIEPPVVNESPLSMECRLHQIVSHGTGYLSANYIIGTVVKFHINKLFFEKNKITANNIEYIGRMGDDFYVHVNSENIFTMLKPE